MLTLHRDYFRLRKPLERRVYEIARKHCGRQAEWRIGLETLLKKSGSTSPRRVFRKMIRDMAAEDGLPDYALSLADGDVVLVRARGRMGGEGEGAAAAGPGGPRPGARGGAGLRSLLARGGMAAALARQRPAAAAEPGGGLPRLLPGAGGPARRGAEAQVGTRAHLGNQLILNRNLKNLYPFFRIAARLARPPGQEGCSARGTSPRSVRQLVDHRLELGADLFVAAAGARPAP